MFMAELDTRGWTLRGIWVTHAHIDHILGVGPGPSCLPTRRSTFTPPTGRSTTT